VTAYYVKAKLVFLIMQDFGGCAALIHPTFKGGVLNCTLRYIMSKIEIMTIVRVKIGSAKVGWISVAHPPGITVKFQRELQ